MAKVRTLGGREAKVATAPKIDEAALERAAHESRRMGVAEKIIYWDKRQGAKVWVDTAGVVIGPEVPDTGEGSERRIGAQLVRSPEVLLCGNDPDHGALTMNSGGSMLMCCKIKQGAGCTYTLPVSL